MTAPASSLEMMLHVEDEAGTIAVGRRLGAALSGGELILLIGDLGAGKTRLAAGIAAGLGVEGEIASPTFVIERIHPGPRTLHHLDLYRLGEVALEEFEIEANLLAGDVVVVEWGERIPAVRRGGAIEIRIEFAGAAESTARLLKIAGPVPASFVLAAPEGAGAASSRSESADRP